MAATSPPAPAHGGEASRRAPFRRLPFAELPERPHRAHRFYEIPARELSMRSEPFGPVRIHYRELGDGPPLLLVHGLMTTSYSFRYVLEPLATRFRVIVPDLPGCGHSDKPDAPYSAAALGTWLVELATALDIRGCPVLGNSLGGYLALRMALADPSSVSRVVCVHAPAFPELRLHALGAALAVPGVRPMLVRAIQRDVLRWAHRNVHYYDETLKSLEEAREYGEPLATENGARAFVKYLREAMAPRGFAELGALLDRAQFPVPLLLVYSRRDPLVSPRIGPRLQKLVPAASLVWIEDASHFVQVDRPDALVEAVLPFLSGEEAR